MDLENSWAKCSGFGENIYIYLGQEGKIEFIARGEKNKAPMKSQLDRRNIPKRKINQNIDKECSQASKAPLHFS